MNDLSSDEEAASTDDESDPEDPTVAWCPPIPDAAEDPSEDEIVSAADKLAILITTREALLSEAGFEKVFGASCFVDDFVSCWGKRGAYRLLLEPT